MVSAVSQARGDYGLDQNSSMGGWEGFNSEYVLKGSWQVLLMGLCMKCIRWGNLGCS